MSRYDNGKFNKRNAFKNDDYDSLDRKYIAATKRRKIENDDDDLNNIHDYVGTKTVLEADDND